MATLSLITPSKITAGDSPEWLIALPDYPATDWMLHYSLVKSGKTITIDGAQYEGGITHYISIDSETSAEYTAGVYSYQAYVTQSEGETITAKHVVERGTIEILPDFSALASGYDDRSFAKTCLDNIEAVIEGRASQAQQEYTIAGRQLKFMTLDELLNARNRFRSEYRAEEATKKTAKTGKSRFGQVQVRFTGVA